MAEENQALREFLYERMYRHPRVKAITDNALKVVRELFAQMLARPELLPEGWRAKADGAGGTGTARLVADYIAGMTDRFALDEHVRLIQ